MTLFLIIWLSAICLGLVGGGLFGAVAGGSGERAAPAIACGVIGAGWAAAVSFVPAAIVGVISVLTQMAANG